MFGELEHVTIAAKDVEALTKWYCDTLSYEVAYKDPKTGTYFIKCGNRSMLEITPANDSPRIEHAIKDAGIRHLAIWVDDFDEAYKVLKDKGVKFVTEIEEEKGVKKVIFFEDIEGNLLHLMYRPKPIG